MDQIDEYEQGERVRAWLRNNGSSLVGGVALGLACLFGWQWWQGKQDGELVMAAGEFRAFTAAVDANEEAKAAAHATALAEQYPGSPYLVLSALRQSALLHSLGKDEEALKVLDAVNGEKLDPMLVELAKLRAARLLVVMGRHEDALARLDAIAAATTDTETGKVAGYPSVAAEIRGDAQMALGRRDDARVAYEQALASLDVAAPTRPMVEMKLTDAGGSPSAQPEI